MTLGLAMIVKDEVEQVAALVQSLSPYIDEAYITVTSKERIEDFKKVFSNNPKVILSEFKWDDDFARARNFNLRQVKTDYWFWVDSDDMVINPEGLRGIMDMMVAEDLDGIYLPYEYMQDEDGVCIALHDRERILKTSHPLVWKGAIHESLISESSPRFQRLDTVIIKHNKKIDEVPVSAERNHKILLKQYNRGKESPKQYDPRTVHYLGLSYFMRREYDKSIELLLEHIKESGWDEEKYRSWSKIAEAHIITGNYVKANAAANAAIDLLPTYPDAYYIKAEIAYEQQAWEAVVSWLETAETKPQPETLSIIDPSRRARTLVLAAVASANLGLPKQAFQFIMQAKKINPDASKVKQFYALFEYAYFEEKALDYMKWLSRFYSEYQTGNVAKLIGSLGPSLFSDIRLAPLRQQYLPSKKWPKRSIVFYCGHTPDTWGPDTLEQGMGGSEEAVVYLSREMAKLGWEVTVYNERDEEYIDGQVTYKPWPEFNPNDQFDVFVGWRAPEQCYKINARLKVVDLHDALDEKRVIGASEYVDKFFVKSRYHRELFPKVSKTKFEIISNGIGEMK